MAKTHTDHVEHPQSLKARAFPFAWHWLTAWLVVPAAATGLWSVGRHDPMLQALLAALVVGAMWVLTYFAFRLAEHAGRKPLIAWHTALTVVATGLALDIVTIAGWTPAFAALYAAGATVGAVSWNLHRVDALRSRPDEKGDENGWPKLLGLARTKVHSQRVEDGAIKATVTVGDGETVADVQSALPKLEAAVPGIIPGRGRVVGDPGSAKRAELTLVTRDVLRTWQPWPGPSHLGGSIADPIVTGFYEDGSPLRYWLPAGFTAEEEPRSATHIGRMGMSRAGKSGDAKVELAEVLTRRDVVLVYADLTKGAQTAGPLMDGVALYADTPAKAKLLFAGMRRLVRDRADLLGRYGFGDWTPECFAHPDLRMPAVVYFIDEADELITNAAFVWLATKALSTGVYLSVTLPRADHGSMPPTARFSIGAWKCFGVGDDYSAEFALTADIVKAGAHPDAWRNTRPGYHYLATAPGVDERLYPMPARSFRQSDDLIRQAVVAGTPHRARLPEADLAALGDAWVFCQPADARRPTTPHQPVGRQPAPTDGDGDDMDDEPEQVDMDDDELEGTSVMTRVLVDDPDPAEADEAGEYRAVDPAREISEYRGPDDVIDDRPEPPSQEDAERAFDQLLIELAGEGKTEVGVAEVAERYPYHVKSWVSRRLTALVDGAVVSPPGLTLERKPGGRAGTYLIHRVNGGHGQ